MADREQVDGRSEVGEHKMQLGHSQEEGLCGEDKVVNQTSCPAGGCRRALRIREAAVDLF